MRLRFQSVVGLSNRREIQQLNEVSKLLDSRDNHNLPAAHWRLMQLELRREAAFAQAKTKRQEDVAAIESQFKRVDSLFKQLQSQLWEIFRNAIALSKVVPRNFFG